MTILLVTVGSLAADRDSVHHSGMTVFVNPASQIVMDHYERKWIKGKRSVAFGAEWNTSAVPNDSDAFAQDYNYPTLSIGAQMSLNHGVIMHRTADPEWGMAVPVDYDSHLGDIVTVYGAFARPLFRTNRWQLDYELKAGLGYCFHPYHTTDNIDNELVGTYVNIFFGAGLTASYRLNNDWLMTAGLQYGHHSNGATDRPNKGENHLGPMIGVRYAPYDKAVRHASRFNPPPFQRYWYANIRLGLGCKTLLEDWQQTQYNTPPDHPDYRSANFRLYASWSAQADMMYRYARRWASGIGVDVYYGTYYRHVADMDAAEGYDIAHSPWSVGVALKHEVYYHRLSMDMAIGYYLHRQMGHSAKEVEKPYYERIGVFYTPPRLGGIKIGASVQAHRTKADLTEMMIGIPLFIFGNTEKM